MSEPQLTAVPPAQLGASPKPATLKSITFLKAWPTAYPTLTAIHVDPETGQRGKIETKAFPPVNGEVPWPIVFNWINERNGKANIYFLVNATREPKDKKPLKADMDAMFALHVDVDVHVGEDQQIGIERIVKTMQSYKIPPTIIVSSGGGAQAFWLFNEPISITDESAAENLERYNVQIARDLAGDKCHNIDRIMRLPGTINIPDKKKRDKGRKPAMAAIMHIDLERRYALNDFIGATDTAQTQRVNGLVPRCTNIVPTGQEPKIVSLDDPRLEKLPNRAKMIMEHGKAIGEVLKKGKDTSRSGWLYDFTCECIRSGVSDALIATIITDRRWKISEPVLEKKDQDREVTRLLARAHMVARVDPGFVDFNDKGRLLSTYRNARAAILAMDIECRYDVFHDRLLIGLRDGVAHEINVPFGEVTDAVLACLRQVICDRFRYDPGKEHVHDAVMVLCQENRFDPVCDYLDECQAKWDGKKRIDKFTINYLGCKDTPLNRVIGEIKLVASVRRARLPGCKHDEIAVLESEEGREKSTALEVLYGRENFSDQMILGKGDREAQELMTGVWGFEIADLAGMERSEVERNKAFASRNTDRGRPAYGRVRVDKPRRCVFWATTNDDEYLKSQTGNRRWWPLAVGRIDVEAIKRDRDQLWGEAAAREAQGASIRLDPALWGEAGAAQEARRERDPWEDKLATVTGNIEAGEARIFSGDLLTNVLEIKAGDQHAAHGKRLARAMFRLGWRRHEHRKVTINGVNASGFYRPATDVALSAVPAEVHAAQDPLNGIM